MRTAIATLMIAAWALPVAVRAGDALEAEMKQDVVLRALVDELERGKVGLELEDLEKPYFIEYALLDAATASASAKLGAVTSRNQGLSRSLRADLRVGSYEQDNTNFSGDSSGFFFGGGFGGRFGGAAIPIEDDYQAIRQAVWWATDRQYKDAIETFEQKKAFMETKLIEDKPEDFSHETPVVDFEERTKPSVDLDRLESMAVALSTVFREYPEIQDSGASLQGGGGNKYMVNTEGTRLRISGMRYSVSVNASVQADDGMKLSDSLSAHARKIEDLPPLEELQRRCRDMAERLIKLKNAPTLESYTGPILFEAEAAASIFARHFSRRFAGGQRNVGSRSNPDDFAKKLDKRILPRFMSVVDDPTQETIADQPVMGHYKYDDQGVKARPVTLVEDGRLKALVMSRNPSKEFKQSTGHGRGAYGPRSATGCLIITASEGADPKTLHQEMMEACQDEDLEYGIRIASLGSMGGGGRSSRYARYFGRSARGGGDTPLLIYKVYPDGREELVRGAQIAQINLKSFKRLLAAGDTPFLLNQGGRSGGHTVVAPAMLFEELDLTKIDQDFDRPPILPAPLAR